MCTQVNRIVPCFNSYSKVGEVATIIYERGKVPGQVKSTFFSDTEKEVRVAPLSSLFTLFGG